MLSPFQKVLGTDVLQQHAEGPDVMTGSIFTTGHLALYFTASTCKGCEKFTPLVHELAAKTGPERLQIVLITSDNDPRALAAIMSSIPRELGVLALPVTWDGFRKKRKELTTRYGVVELPTLVLLNPDGTTATADAARLLKETPDGFPWALPSPTSYRPRLHEFRIESGDSVPVLHSPRRRSLTAANATVFFLPASHSTARSFMKIAEDLGDAYSTVLVDRPTEGTSNSNDRLDEIKQIFEHFGTNINVLVGHGDGGNAAMRLACMFTKKQVDAVALIGCGASPPPRTLLRNAPDWLLECLWPVLVRRAITREFHSTDQSTDHIRRVAIAEAQLMTPSAARALLLGLRWFNNDTARGILAPVTVMAGEYDANCPPKEAEKLAKTLVKGRAVIVKGAGNRAFEERPDVVGAEVKRLLDEVLTRGSIEVDSNRWADTS